MEAFFIGAHLRSRYVRFGSLGILDTEVVMGGEESAFRGANLWRVRSLCLPLYILYYNVRARIDRSERW